MYRFSVVFCISVLLVISLCHANLSITCPAGFRTTVSAKIFQSNDGNWLMGLNALFFPFVTGTRNGVPVLCNGDVLILTFGENYYVDYEAGVYCASTPGALQNLTSFQWWAGDECYAGVDGIVAASAFERLLPSTIGTNGEPKVPYSGCSNVYINCFGDYVSFSVAGYQPDYYLGLGLPPLGPPSLYLKQDPDALTFSLRKQYSVSTEFNGLAGKPAQSWQILDYAKKALNWLFSFLTSPDGYKFAMLVVDHLLTSMPPAKLNYIKNHYALIKAHHNASILTNGSIVKL